MNNVIVARPTSATVAVVAALLLQACGVVTDSIGGKADGAKEGPSGSYEPVFVSTRPTEAVPRAICGGDSHPENGVQGEVTKLDRVSGRSQLGYNCNLELVGAAARGEGSSWMFAWYDDCGYYGTLASTKRRTAPGAVVIDARDPAHPFVSDILTTPAVLDPHESLKANEKRALLAADDVSGQGDYNGTGDNFDVYDVSGDCAHPRLLSTTQFAGTSGHEGEWAPDGMTYYGTGVVAYDVTDPANPDVFATLSQGTHGLGISDDGNRGYMTGSVSCQGGADGMKIVDLSDIQSRKADPQTPVVGEICWTDGVFPQHAIPVRIQGKPYVVFVTEAGRGAARLIDISDEAHPFIASYLKLEVHLDQYAAMTGEGQHAMFVYDAHYCGVDSREEATAVACGYFESGIRVFDIRDPLHPAEIAYYVPPAQPGRDLPGSSRQDPGLGGAEFYDGTADHCTSQVRFRRTADGGGQLWAQCQDNEFMILRFTNDAWPFDGP
jgi:hypothetical protein